MLFILTTVMLKWLGKTTSQPLHQDRVVDPQNFGGVGIIFLKAPDNSLFVKSLIEGSGAAHSGIKIGDCLMKVDGKNVYCKGTEEAAKAILGPLGTAVHLKFARIIDNKRITINASLIREMKATVDPLFSISDTSSKYSSGLNTRQVFLECLQAEEEKKAQAAARQKIEERNVGGVEDTAAGDDSASAHQSGGRKVFFEGKWYTEEEVEQLEKMAVSIDVKIKEIEESKMGKRQNSGSLKPSNQLVDKQSLPAAPLSVTRTLTEVDEAGIAAAILVVQGGPLLCSKKFLGSVAWRSNQVSISTGGMLLWGSSIKEKGQALWARVKQERYDPSMNATDFDFINRKFEVMIEAGDCEKPIVAFSIDGGTVQAAPNKTAKEFVAKDEEERNRWVLGINSVLEMAKSEAQERVRRRQQETKELAAFRSPNSVFITSPSPSSSAPASSHEDSPPSEMPSKAPVWSGRIDLSPGQASPDARSRRSTRVAGRDSVKTVEGRLGPGFVSEAPSRTSSVAPVLACAAQEPVGDVGRCGNEGVNSLDIIFHKSPAVDLLSPSDPSAIATEAALPSYLAPVLTSAGQEPVGDVGRSGKVTSWDIMLDTSPTVDLPPSCDDTAITAAAVPSYHVKETLNIAHVKTNTPDAVLRYAHRTSDEMPSVQSSSRDVCVGLSPPATMLHGSHHSTLVASPSVSSAGPSGSMYSAAGGINGGDGGGWKGDKENTRESRARSGGGASRADHWPPRASSPPPPAPPQVVQVHRTGAGSITGDMAVDGTIETNGTQGVGHKTEVGGVGRLVRNGVGGGGNKESAVGGGGVKGEEGRAGSGPGGKNESRDKGGVGGKGIEGGGLVGGGRKGGGGGDLAAMMAARKAKLASAEASGDGYYFD